MPRGIVKHYHPGFVAKLAGAIACLLYYRVHDCLPAAVLGFELLGKANGLGLAVGHQETIGCAGIVYAPGGVETRADDEADPLGVHARDVYVREPEQRLEAGHTVLLDSSDPMGHKRAVGTFERHYV